MEKNSAMIKFRIKPSEKENWKKLCLARNTSLTQLIIDSVEGRLLENERRKIFMYLEEQGNFFVKIETNINQVAKVANAQKSISDQALKNFTQQVAEIKKLKEEQNKIFLQIYKMIGR